MKTQTASTLLLFAWWSFQPAMAQPDPSCVFSAEDLRSDYSPDNAKSPKSSEQFYSLPRGAVALGEQCDPATNVCKKNFVITSCLEVEYAVDVFQDTSFNIVINTSIGCEKNDDCPIQSGHIAAAVVYINNNYSFKNQDRVEVIRNAGWFLPHDQFTPHRYEKFLDTAIRVDRVDKFFKFQADPNSRLGPFQDEVVDYFHATPAPGSARSWDHKIIFGTAFSRLKRCESDNNNCTLKAYLQKFSETPRGIPGKAVRINGVLSRAEGIDLQTYAPIGNNVYTFSKTIRFTWRAPLPKPRPIATLEAPASR